MKIRFGYELGVGILGLISCLFMGPAALAIMALQGFYPLIYRLQGKPKMDERELEIFFKTGNYTMGLMFIVMTAIYLSGHLLLAGTPVVQMWFPLCVFGFLFCHGGTGLFMSRA